MKGKVYLVGAGPGDAGLLTHRGYALLQRADVVVADALVGPAVLAMIPAGTRCIRAGKRAGGPSMDQDEIGRILLREALAGGQVVRLKGGDPMLFGRGGEELALLAAHGVNCEVVPGVPSALAVPAYGGIPVTHRDYAASLHIIAAHRRAGAPLALDYPALARLEGTLVFLMGLGALPELCRGLLAAGMDPETPAAAIQQGTTAGQRRVCAALASLSEAAAGLEAPALIVVGAVCALAESLAWAERRPLFGRRILVTRPAPQAEALTERLRDLGAEVVAYPTVALRLLPEADLSGLADCRWLALTSPSGVALFFELLRRQRRDVRSLAGLKVAALGPGTAAALAERGIFADLVPPQHDAAGLGRALAARLAPGERVFLARARQGSPALPAALPPGSFRDCALYETVWESPPAVDIGALLRQGPWAVFTSGSTVRGLAAAAGETPLDAVRALCIGRQTAAVAAEFGMKTYISRESSVDALVELALACSKEETK